MFSPFESQIQSIEIVCQDNGIFFGGQDVVGKVVIEVDNEKSIKALSLRCVGKANVEWTETDFGNQSKREIITNIKTESFSSEEIYFDETQWLLKNADGSEVWLSPGRTELDFIVQLPNSLPASFKGEYGSVKYFLQAGIISEARMNRETQCILNVRGQFDLNEIDNLTTKGLQDKEPIRITKEKYFGFLCCTKGPLGFHFSLQKLLYIPEDCVKLTVDFFNSSNEMEHFLSAVLTETVTFQAEHQSKEISKDIIRIEGPELIPYCNDTWSGDLFCIPNNIPPTNLGGCQIITLEYKIKILITCMKKVILEAEQPIIVGTIPLAPKKENTIVELFATD